MDGRTAETRDKSWHQRPAKNPESQLLGRSKSIRIQSGLVHKKGAAGLCWKCKSPVHAALQVAHVTSVTCSWGSLTTLIVTVSTVHSL